MKYRKDKSDHYIIKLLKQVELAKINIKVLRQVTYV